MTHKMPWIMGAMMGLMVPAMFMGGMPGGGLAFVLGHVVVVGAAVGVAWVGIRLGKPQWRDAVQRALGHHRPQLSHAFPFAAAFALTFGLVHVAHSFGLIGAA